MKAYKVLLLLFLFSQQLGKAQAIDFANANKEYDLLRYKAAIPYYLKGLKIDSLNQNAIEHLANSYRNIKDYKNSEIWYAKAVALNPSNPENNLHYAEILANNAKYDRSRIYYQKYIALNSSDTRARRFAQAYENMSVFFSDSSQWRIRFTTINTNFDEFSPVFFRDGLIFVSNRGAGVTRHVSVADQKPFTDLYIISDTDKITPVDLSELDIPAGSDVEDNRALGNFNVKPLSRISLYDYEAGNAPATRLAGVLNSKLNDGPISFPADESWVMFTRNNNNTLQLFSARYLNGMWSKVEAFPYNSKEFSISHPALSADGNILYFASNMPGGYGGTDLYYCTRIGYSWSTPVNLGDKVNTVGDEMFPFLDRSGNLYFSSTGLPGLGGLDIFAVSLNGNLPAGAPKNLGYPLNSSKDDFGIVTSYNGISGYFSSNRKGTDDIYRFDFNPGVKTPDVLAQNNNPQPKPLTAPGGGIAAGANIPAGNAAGGNASYGNANPPVQVKDTSKTATQPSLADSRTSSEQDSVIRSVRNANGNAYAFLKFYSQRGSALVDQDRSLDQTKLLALHSTAPIGTILTVINPVNGKNVYARVAGRLTGNNDRDVIVILTKETADQIGAAGTKFQVTVNYNTWVIDGQAVLATEPYTSVPEPDRQTAGPVNSAPRPSADGQRPPVSGTAVAGTTNPAQQPATPASQPAGQRPRTVTNSGQTPSAPVQKPAAPVQVASGTQAPAQQPSRPVSQPSRPAPAPAPGRAPSQSAGNPPPKSNETQGASSNATPTGNRMAGPNSIILTENTTVVATIGASDADAGAAFIYSLSGGQDVSKFRINSSTGLLTFISPPDFERPADADGNNTYILKIRVSDGAHSSEETVSVVITDVNDNNPVITSKGDLAIAENSMAVTTIKATDADAGTFFTYSLNGGPDAEKFSINSNTGALTFLAAPDFENPADHDGNNTYMVGVRVSDGANFTDQMMKVTVTDVNDNAPVITSNQTFTVAENNTFISTIAARDADAGTNFSYSLNGGADAGKFRINSSSGSLSFISSPDFENPADADANNSYTLVVKASDGKNISEQSIVVNVTDVNDNKPVFTSAASFSVPENSSLLATLSATDADAGSTLSYGLSGGPDGSKFRINSSTGALTFISAPDFEHPGDADGNNIYIVGIRVSDGINTTEQTIKATVTDVNDNSPVITSNTDFFIPENTSAVTTIKATDADAGSTFTYSLSGGSDVSKFRISSSGVLSFISPADFENPGDADANNTYIVIVKVTDGTNTADQTVTVTVTDVNDNAPVIRLFQ